MLADLELAKERAIAQRVRNEKEAGRLWEADQVVREFGELLSHFRAVLCGLPDAVASEFAEGERARTFEVAKHHVERSLALLASWKPGAALPDSAPKRKGRRHA
jgi:hypothetical protein